MKASKALQLKMLIWKNWLLQKRSPVRTVIEIIIPIILVVILVSLRTLTTTETTNELVSCSTAVLPHDITRFYYYTQFSEDLVATKEQKDSNFCNSMPLSLVQNGIENTFSKIAFAPSGIPMVNNIIDSFVLQLELLGQPVNVSSFLTEQTLLEATAVDEGIGLAIVFFEDDNGEIGEVGFTPNRIHYVLRPRQPNAEFAQQFDTANLFPQFVTANPDEYYSDVYLDNSNFVVYQSLLDNAIVLANGVTPLIFPRLRLMSWPSFSTDNFYSVIRIFLPLVMVICFISPVASIVYSIVYEKEKRLKESMKMMGLTEFMHWLGWFIKCFSYLLFTVIIMTIAFGVGELTPKSDTGVIFILLLLNMIASIAYGFLISTFFSKASLAAFVGGLLFYVGYVPYSFEQHDLDSLSAGSKAGLCLFSPSCLGIGADVLSAYEGRGEGLQFSNLASDPSAFNTFSMADVFGMLIFDIFLYIFLTWYISNVFPGQYGVAQPFYFFLTKSFWFGVKPIVDSSADEVVEVDTSLVETPPSDATPGIVIKKLRKIFKAETGGSKVAVENLSMKMFENQITALLGHNGAGKTTTLSMLVGLFSPTSGSATVGGHDVIHDTEGVRESLGICPQHNILFDALTIEEHIMFFSRLKGLSVDEAKQEIDRYVVDLDLESKRKDLSKTLSGGQQRALSLGVALCGDSKVVILDEPTSGMDPYKRRQTWNLLLKHKVGRTMVLTTHFMEEADILGDRIAIMANGQLRTLGSSLFLKKRFGVGYHMTMVKEPGCNVSSISNLIRSHVAGATIQTEVGTELSFVLPKEQSANFPEMMENLDQEKDNLKIASYGISATTMEEVFLKVTEGFVSFGEHESISDQSGAHGVLIPEENVKATAKRVALSQLKTMLTKRFLYAIRNKWNLVTQIVLPLLFAILALSLASIAEKVDDAPRLKVDLSTYPSPTVWVASTDTAGDYKTRLTPDVSSIVGNIAQHNSSSKSAFLSELEAHLSSFSAVTIQSVGTANISAKILEASADYQRNNFFSNNLLAVSAEPGPYRILYDTNTTTCGSWTNNGSISSAPLYFEGGNSYPFAFFNYFGNPMYVSTSSTTKTGGFDPLDGSYNSGSTSGLVTDFTLTLDSAFLSSNPSRMFLFCGPLSDSSQTPLELNFGAANTSDPSSIVTYVEYSPRAIHSPAVATNLIGNAMVRQYIDPDMRIYTYNHPLPRSASKSTDSLLSNGLGLGLGLNMMFACAFLAASFALFLVNERISKAKHIQFVSGVSPAIYWLANLLWDLLTCLPSALLFLIIVSSQLKSFDGHYGELFLLYMFSMFAAIPLVYIVSIPFASPSNAYGAISILAMIIGMAGILGTFISPLVGSEEIGDIFRYVFTTFLPNVALGQGIYDVWLNAQYGEIYHQYSFACGALNVPIDDDVASADIMDALSFCTLYKPNFFGFALPGIGKILLTTFCMGVFWSILLLLIEYGILRFPRPKPFLAPKRNEDNDVQAERERVSEAWNKPSLGTNADNSVELVSTKKHSSGKPQLLVHELTQVFKKKGSFLGSKNKFTAVDHLSFAVDCGECFGLLGVNGAGKTSTFGMLTGEKKPSHGDIVIGGVDLLQNVNEARRDIGYCPQFDALIGLLTGREHISMYARIRGVPENKVDVLVSSLIERLGLHVHANKPAYTYSGGNKRKLSTAIALIGSPQLVLLDEPTTGMDPEARRFLWSVLDGVTKAGQSIILTSHSMEECEALCHRLAIMVNGKFKCIGSPGHLKHKFGKGAKLQIKAKVDNHGAVADIRPIKDFIETKIGGCVVEEEYNGVVKYKVVTEDHSWAFMFRVLEEAKHKFDLEDYGISEVSLEEVFVHFAAEQHSDEMEREGVFSQQQQPQPQPQ
eukprot:m.110165 g.110165  ORF g.110165 m.110165 type:complete len:1869 (+) comp9218_c2_seq1:80-5686(+)